MSACDLASVSGLKWTDKRYVLQISTACTSLLVLVDYQ